MATELTNEDYAALRFRSLRGINVGRDQLAGNHGDSIDYRAMAAHIGGYSRHLSPADKLRQEWRTGETTREYEEFRRHQAVAWSATPETRLSPGSVEKRS